MANRLEHSTVLSRAPEILEAEAAGQVILSDAAAGTYFALDSVGSFIWSKLLEPVTAGEIESVCVQAYKGDAGRIGADVMALLQQLEENGLVLRV